MMSKKGKIAIYVFVIGEEFPNYSNHYSLHWSPSCLAIPNINFDIQFTTSFACLFVSN